MRRVKAIDPERLRAALESLGERINAEVAWVNHGGCGIVAVEVGKQLQRIGIECDIATGGDPGTLPAALVRDEVDDPEDPFEWDRAGLGRGHLAIRFPLGGIVYTWDTDGFAPDDAPFLGGSEWVKSGRFGTGLTVAETAAICRPLAGWNRTFDRAQVPTIRRLVREAFAEVKA